MERSKREDKEDDEKEQDNRGEGRRKGRGANSTVVEKVRLPVR